MYEHINHFIDSPDVYYDFNLSILNLQRANYSIVISLDQSKEFFLILKILLGISECAAF